MRSLLLILALLAASSPAFAVTLRYAVVIGNDRGVPERGLPDLEHAEREATELRGLLVDLARFEPDPERTVLLLRPDRAALAAALSALARRMAEDEARHGDVHRVFGFFFTGHGLDGHLVMKDGLLPKAALADLFRRVDADLTLGVFDACYSANLDPGSLVAKGIRATPGVNVVQSLPAELLTAEGAVWLVSSAKDEPSYEDRKLGGVFTHFFMQALRDLPPSGPGVTLEQVWQHARDRTVAHTAARNRRQTPTMITRLERRGALYLSFPKPRDATLVLGPELQGDFLLDYGQGQWTERVDKRSGHALEVAVYPGEADLLVRRGAPEARTRLALTSGARLVVRRVDAEAPQPEIGTRVTPLRAKGLEARGLAAHVVEPAATWWLGVEGGYGGRSRDVLGPDATVTGSLRYEGRGLALGLEVGWGRSQRSYEAWGYSTSSGIGELSAGWAFDLSRLRLSAGVAAGFGVTRQRFEDGATRTTGLFQPSALVTATHPLGRHLALRLSLRGGALLAPGAGIDAGLAWAGMVRGAVGLAVRLP